MAAQEFDITNVLNFEELDSYLSGNLKTLTCGGFYNLWSQGADIVIKYHGTTAQFSGWFAELLLLRFLIALLENRFGGKFQHKQSGVTNYIDSFINKESELECCPSLKFELPGRQRGWKPDITIRRNNEPFAVIEVKRWLTSKRAWENLKQSISLLLLQRYPNPFFLLVVFEIFKEDISELDRKRFAVISLTGNQNNMAEQFAPIIQRIETQPRGGN